MNRAWLERLLRSVGYRGEGDTPASGDNQSIETDGGTATEQAVPQQGILRRTWTSEFIRSLPFWLPASVLMAIFVYGAIGWNSLISLTDWSGLGNPNYGNLDFSMYAQLVSDPTFINALKNTIVLLVVFTGGSLIMGLVVAILVNRDIQAESGFRTIYLLPMSLSFVVTALFWTWMYNPSSGVINTFLETVGLGFLTRAWLSNPQFALGAVIFALMWQFSGYAMVVYLAGLRAIPNDQYEAARVDGASTIRLYWRVIIPQLRASTMSAAVVLIVFALKAFDFLFVMFGDTPGPAVDILALMMFREAFSTSNWAYGSAVAVVLFVLALAVIAPYIGSQYARGEL